MHKSGRPSKVAVFACSAFVLPMLDRLKREEKLAGVILPDPSEHPATALEIHNLAAQFHAAAIPHQLCCREKLPQIVRQLDAWQASLGLIATFPHVVPANIIDFFSLGLFNLHASPLPAYRGPMPLYWQIRNQEKETALVIHRAEVKPDVGDIVINRKVAIHPLDTLASLTNCLSGVACEAVSDLMALIDENEEPPDGAPQPVFIESSEHLPGREYARRPTPDSCLVDFKTMSAQAISAMCRAGAGQPFAATLAMCGVPLNLLQTTVVDVPTYGTLPGTIIFVAEPEGLIVATSEGALRLDIVAGADGVFSGLAFAERFQIDPGMQL